LLRTGKRTTMTEESDASTPTPQDVALVEEWERTIEDRSTKERVYEVVTTLTDPATVSTIAERADCSPNGARSNLEWFADLGIADVVGTDPVRYRRNEAYFEFLRAHRLVREHDRESLAALVEEFETQDAALAESFDVEAPDAVDPMTVETAFEALLDRVNEWGVVRRRLGDLRRARLLAERRDHPDSGPVPV
jgi:hypothetical protein